MVFECHEYNYLAVIMRYNHSEAKLREPIHRKSNYSSEFACSFQNMAGIYILKSRFPLDAHWAYFLHPACQASLKCSQLSSKFINYDGVRESGGVGGEWREISGFFQANLKKEEQNPYSVRTQTLRGKGASQTPCTLTSEI